MKPQIPRFATARGGAVGALALVALLVACSTELPTSEEISSMDVAAAETGAAQVSLIGNGDEVVYKVDGVRVSADQAHALDANSIASVQITRTRQPGDTSRVSIMTKVAAADMPPALPVPPDAPPAPPVVSAPPTPPDAPAPPRSTTASMSQFNGLLMVDGVKVAPSALEKIKPETIESIEVIKSPSATQQYSDPAAANGVIRVTTKKAAGMSQNSGPVRAQAQRVAAKKAADAEIAQQAAAIRAQTAEVKRQAMAIRADGADKAKRAAALEAQTDALRKQAVAVRAQKADVVEHAMIARKQAAAAKRVSEIEVRKAVQLSQNQEAFADAQIALQKQLEGMEAMQAASANQADSDELKAAVRQREAQVEALRAELQKLQQEQAIPAKQ